MFTAVAAALLLASAPAAPAAPAASPDAVLADLLAGNERFAAAKPLPHPFDAAAREKLAAGQHPKAIVVTCSDSRVPPEILFDQGVGDLFVVRLAGNVAAPSAIGSVEYAAEHLGASLVVVLGHTRCGAVKATADGKGEAPTRDLESIVTEIAPAVQHAAASGAPDLLHAAERENARLVARRLVNRSQLVFELVQEKKLKIVSGVYDLRTGRIEIDAPPVAEVAKHH